MIFAKKKKTKKRKAVLYHALYFVIIEGILSSLAQENLMRVRR